MNARERLIDAAWEAVENDEFEVDRLVLGLDAFLAHPDDLIALLVETGALEVDGVLTLDGIPRHTKFRRNIDLNVLARSSLSETVPPAVPSTEHKNTEAPNGVASALEMVRAMAVVPRLECATCGGRRWVFVGDGFPKRRCPDCAPSGASCPACNGTGFDAPLSDEYGASRACPECNGSGRAPSGASPPTSRED